MLPGPRPAWPKVCDKAKTRRHIMTFVMTVPDLELRLLRKWLNLSRKAALVAKSNRGACNPLDTMRDVLKHRAHRGMLPQDVKVLGFDFLPAS
jgi:hypothetical protein